MFGILIIPEPTQPQLRCQAIVLELERLRKISENIVQDHQDRSWANWTMSSLMKSIFNRHCSNLLPLAVGNWLPWGCWTEMLSFEWAASANFRKRLGPPKSFVGPAWRKKTTKASLEPWPCLWSFSRYWFQFEKAWNLGKPWLLAFGWRHAPRLNLLHLWSLTIWFSNRFQLTHRKVSQNLVGPKSLGVVQQFRESELWSHDVSCYVLKDFVPKTFATSAHLDSMQNWIMTAGALLKLKGKLMEMQNDETWEIRVRGSRGFQYCFSGVSAGCIFVFGMYRFGTSLGCTDPKARVVIRFGEVPLGFACLRIMHPAQCVQNCCQMFLRPHETCPISLVFFLIHQGELSEHGTGTPFFALSWPWKVSSSTFLVLRKPVPLPLAFSTSRTPNCSLIALRDCDILTDMPG